MISEIIFNDTNYQPKKQLLAALFFGIVTIGALGIDSVYFAKHFFDGRVLTNCLVISYFGWLFFISNGYLRQLMFSMLFLSYIGELIFCNLLEMYAYRTQTIPLYVPFGHAIVYVSGYIFAQTAWVLQHEFPLKRYFGLGFAILFLAVGIFLNDLFSVVLGVLFFAILKRKRWQNLYYCIALCVIFIELVGTFFGCWTWVPKIFGIIPAANPPMGAVFIYAGGDVLLAKIVSKWTIKK